MAKIERGGIRLVVENYEQFTRQLNAASASMSGFGQSAQRTASQVSASASEYRGSSVVVEEWTETIDTSAEASAAAAQSMTMLGLALGALGAAAGALLVSFGLQASRIEELGVLLEVTRKNAIYMANAQDDLERATLLSSDAVQEQVQGIRDLHLSGQVANRAVADLIRYNLDWTKATELARLAQDAATFAMQDSSEAVKGLIHGITTLQPRVLRTYGLMINLTEAYRKFADANDIVNRELTIAERQQAAFQEVLALAPSIAGAYEAAMGTAAKQIRSFKTDIVNLAEAFGEEYTPALDAAVGVGRKFLHALTDLSDPLQAFLSYATAAGAAVSVLVGAIITLGPKVVALTGELWLLATAGSAAQLALLGLGAAALVGIPLLIGAAAALHQAEEARREEASSILVSSENYDEYVSALKNAELSNYTLVESLYDVIKGHQDATDAAMAQAEAEEILADVQSAKSLFAIYKVLGGLTAMAEGLRTNIHIMDESQLALYANEEALLRMALAEGYTIKQSQAFAETVSDLARKEIFLRDISRALTKEVEDWDYHARQAADATEKLTDRQKWLRAMSYEATDALKALTDELQEYYKWLVVSAEMTDNFAKAEAKAFESATDKLTDAHTRRNRALQDLDIKYHDKSEDAWIKYQRAIQETEGDLAAFHTGTLNELLEIDRDYLQDRNDAWEKYQQDLRDAERDLQRDIEDASRDRAQKLSDIEAEYAQDRVDALRELNEDLQDNARDHAEKLVDIEQTRQQSLLDLEEEYQRRLYDIQNLAAQRLRDLQDTYDEKASDVRLKFLRESLEQIEREGWFVGDAYKQILRDLFLGLREFGAGDIPSDFRDAYYKMLQELEDLQDDQRWEEEDLSDDIDREQEKRLEDLEEWLAEEQAAIEAAYATRTDKENERFAEEQESRRQDYEKKLEDLQRANEREKAEIELNHRRRLDDIRLQAEREREELARVYGRRLEDLEIEYNRERALVKQKLEEQNQAAQEKYDEALEDIERAKQRERKAINREFDLTKKDIKADYKEAVTAAAEEFHQMPAAFQPVWDQMKRQAEYEVGLWADIILGGFGRVQTRAQQMGFLGRSPAPWWQKMAASWAEGIEAGFDGDALTANVASAMGDLQSQIAGGLPVGRASVPMAGGGDNRSYASTSNLTVQAQYAHQSEASLRDDLSLYNSMLGAWGR